MYNIGDIVISKNGGIKYRILETGTLYTLESVVTGKRKYLGEWVLNDYFILSTQIAFKVHVQQFIPPDLDNKMLYLITGLIEESGELMQLLRRQEYKKQHVQRDDIKEEIGDILFFLTGIASEFGLNYDEVKKFNINKLNKRFPKGSWNRTDAIKKVDHNE